MLSTLISTAIINAAANIEFTTKDEFMAALIESLFSGVSVTVPVVPEKKPRKPRAKKAEPETTSAESSDSAPEPVVAEKEKKPRKPRAKKAAAVAVEEETTSAESSDSAPEPVVAEKEKKPRKPRAKKAEPETTSAESASESGDSAPEPVVAEKEKKAPKPRAKKEKDTTAPAQNIEKLNPTQTKKIKAIYEELKAGKDVDKKAILEFFNAMTPEVFNSKKFEEHIRAFLAPPPAAAVAPLSDADDEGEEVFDVTFKGKKYIVSMDKKVYETDENGDATFVVGNVGMAEFAEMKIEE